MTYEKCDIENKIIKMMFPGVPVLIFLKKKQTMSSNKTTAQYRPTGRYLCVRVIFYKMRDRITSLWELK